MDCVQEKVTHKSLYQMNYYQLLTCSKDHETDKTIIIRRLFISINHYFEIARSRKHHDE